ncbi:MAG: YIP1 family protein, partial [Candidatus Kryptoniota bacterium]
QAKERMENGSPMFMAIGIIGAFFATFIIFFITAGAWLFIGKIILKGSTDYSQSMGVAGISSWIMVLGTIMAIVVTVLLSRPDGGLHLGMFVQMNPSDKTYSLLRSADLFTIWNLAATSIGIGTISGKKGILPYAWVFGIWVALMLIIIFVFGGLFGG